MSDKIIEMEYELQPPCSGKQIFKIVCIFVAFIGGVYLYANNVKEQKEKVLASDRCNMQLASTKHLIEVMKEYKDRTDKMLADTQKYHETDQSRFKEVMETCFAMTQQSAACQIQLDALQFVCKTSRSDCLTIAKELDQLKTLTNTTELI